MASANHRIDDRPRENDNLHRDKPSTSGQQTTNAVPAQEWGERIETGKAIARGGKSTGRVPGAQESK